MAKRFARKVKRAGKAATQFRFTSTFEYIDLSCNGTWRPEKLRVIWLRSHRRVQSTEAEFVVTEDNGPNGAEGRAVFDPPITVSLVVTLYRDAKKQEFDEKEYKYYIEHEDQSGKKILSSFNCDMSEYAGIPTSRHALEMNFKPVSRKITKSLLGITLESQFIKEGKDTDDDMQSTFSSMDPTQSVMYADDEDDDVDDDDLDEAATLGIKADNLEESTATQKGGEETTEQEEQPGDTPQDEQEEETDRQPDNNPFDDQPPPAENPFDEPQPCPMSGGEAGKNGPLIDSWLPDVQFVDSNDVPVTRDKIDSADVIGLYFSAQWCPPCRRFLPKLLEFYSALKNNGKSFELIYVSNDNSRTEMIQYMAEQQMPWLAIPHGHALIDKLKLNFKVRSIPLLVIVSASGDVLDDNAKKAVENSHGAASSVVKQYIKWAEKMGGEDEVKQKSTGILGSIKKALSSKEEEATPPTTATTTTEPTESLRESAESKSPKVKINDKFNKDELLRQLQEKDDLVRHLEEVNQSLKHTNEELNTDLRTLKSSLEQSEAKVKGLEETTAQKREEYAKFQEHLKVQGWLFKKGAKGPTANVFRKRYFRLDQGSKLYYYKSQSEGTPQGFIDLVKIITVTEVSQAQQDKNNATFNIDCEGRVYQLLAHDETEMRKWISAIQYLKEYYKKKGHE